MITMSQTRRRVTHTQLLHLCEFLNNHRDIAVGYNKSAQAREHSKRMWDRVAAVLNSTGEGAVKSGPEWSKYWVDLKAKIKRKNRSISNARQATGGGPPLTEELSEVENRFLALLGEDYGSGLPGVQVDPLPQTSQDRRNQVSINQSVVNENEPLHLEIFNENTSQERRYQVSINQSVVMVNENERLHLETFSENEPQEIEESILTNELSFTPSHRNTNSYLSTPSRQSTQSIQPYDFTQSMSSRRSIPTIPSQQSNQSIPLHHPQSMSSHHSIPSMSSHQSTSAVPPHQSTPIIPSLQSNQSITPQQPIPSIPPLRSTSPHSSRPGVSGTAELPRRRRRRGQRRMTAQDARERLVASSERRVAAELTNSCTLESAVNVLNEMVSILGRIEAKLTGESSSGN